MTTHSIKIDPEFKALIPPLKPEELAQLEQNIITDGCRDPLVVWSGLLVDGHNRFEICNRHGIEFNVVEMEFFSRDEAEIWILQNQLGRRNLTDYVRVELALLLKPLIAKKSEEVRRESQGRPNKLSQNSDAVIEFSKVRTDETIAAAAGVSRDTVRKVESIRENAPEEVQEATRAGVMSIHLSSQVAALPDEEKAAVAAAPIESIKEVAQEAVKRAHVANNSGNNEWYTPEKYIALARSVMGSIDLDPASSEIANRVIQAETFFTAEDDGRTKQWDGNVWMNPPYAQPLISDFAEAVASKFQSGEIRQACILVNNATETQWFQRMMEAARAVCFTKGRIKFVDVDGNPGGSPLQGQAIIYMGPYTREFADAFRAEGTVLENV